MENLEPLRIRVDPDRLGNVEKRGKRGNDQSGDNGDGVLLDRFAKQDRGENDRGGAYGEAGERDFEGGAVKSQQTEPGDEQLFLAEQKKHSGEQN